MWAVGEVWVRDRGGKSTRGQKRDDAFSNKNVWWGEKGEKLGEGQKVEKERVREGEAIDGRDKERRFRRVEWGEETVVAFWMRQGSVPI